MNKLYIIRFLLITSILVISFSSCKENELPRVSIDELPYESLAMDKLDDLVDPFAPHIYLLNDTLLFFLPRFSASLFRVYHVNSGKLQTAKIQSREGSLKVSDDPLASGSVAFENNAVDIYCEYTMENGVLRLTHTSSMRLEDLVPYEVIKPEDKVYIALGGKYKDGVFAVINKKNKWIHFYGTYPLKERRFRYKMYLNDYKGHMSMEGDDVFYVSENFGYIASYRYQKQGLKLNWEKQLTDFKVKDELTYLKMEDDHSFGFQGIVAKKKYIYTLYNGFGEKGKKIPGKSLLIFDRKGNPVAHYQLPQTVQHFVVDDKEEYMYASCESDRESTYIARFRIPSIKK